uniref:Uncharacterized protein n=1 Tax=Nelumbo nucifera TaxID=4432 RepID=A0A822Y4C9_NELNU|nr:TPA_asm: hypothetical protein HUJ06_027929 [Nelumbo nucifera]
MGVNDAYITPKINITTHNNNDSSHEEEEEKDNLEFCQSWNACSPSSSSSIPFSFVLATTFGSYILFSSTKTISQTLVGEDRTLGARRTMMPYRCP